ncbi:MAG TPA: efflux RND transporter periplasmic adaptor subunit [Burkholderiales bacterium]|nr:efflux RND transporter periplasmic adaptor subunit [Burkholderiales bacterium]
MRAISSQNTTVYFNSSSSGISPLARGVLNLVLLGAVAASASACGQKVEKTAVAKAAAGGVALSDASLKFLTVEEVGSGGPRAYGPIPGKLAMRPQASSSLGAPTAGRVVSVLVRPGEPVTPGKVLVTLQSADAAGARASVEQASARAAGAEENLRRQNEMVAKGVGLELERFEAETRAREARAELERAGRASSLVGAGKGDVVSLRAPSAGVVVSIKAAVGAMVAPGGETLVEIADPTRLWVVADVPESDTRLVSKGQKVSVSIPSARREMDGVVDGLGSRIEPDTRRLSIYIHLKGDVAGLSSGMYAELRFETTGETLTVPVTAVLIKNGTQRIVYVQRSDGRFEARPVRAGQPSGGRVAILEGLKPGERIVVKGALLLDTAAEQLL